MLDLFKKAIKDGNVTGAGIKTKKKDLINLIDKVFKIEEEWWKNEHNDNISRKDKGKTL